LSGRLAATRISRLVGFGVAVVIIAGAQWATASIYFVHWEAWQPFAYAAISVVFAYPVVSVLFSPKSE